MSEERGFSGRVSRHVVCIIAPERWGSRFSRKWAHCIRRRAGPLSVERCTECHSMWCRCWGFYRNAQCKWESHRPVRARWGRAFHVNGEQVETMFRVPSDLNRVYSLLKTSSSPWIPLDKKIIRRPEPPSNVQKNRHSRAIPPSPVYAVSHYPSNIVMTDVLKFRQLPHRKAKGNPP